MSKLIYVYNDKGCAGVDHITKWLRRHIDDVKVKEVNAEDIAEKGVLATNEPYAMVLGGGESIYYNGLLKKQGMDNIRDAVGSGMKFIGLCAGACCACSEIWYRDSKKKMYLGEEHNQLALFKGIAIGDVCDFRGDGDHRHVAQVDFKGKKAGIYYYKGPYFDKLSTNDKVLAKFDGLTSHAAVVKSKYGEGDVILSSIHPEYDAKTLKQHNIKLGISNPNLKVSQEDIDAFSRYILSDLVLKSRQPSIRHKLHRAAQRKLVFK